MGKYDPEYYKRNREHILQKNRESDKRMYDRDPELAKLKQRKYYAETLVAKRAYSRKWYYENHAKELLRVRLYRERNRDKLNAGQREAYHRDIDKGRKRMAVYHAANRELLNEKARQYYKENPEKHRDSVRRSREKHREKNIEYGRTYARSSHGKATRRRWQVQNKDYCLAKTRKWASSHRFLQNTLDASAFVAGVRYMNKSKRRTSHENITHQQRQKSL